LTVGLLYENLPRTFLVPSFFWALYFPPRHRTSLPSCSSVTSPRSPGRLGHRQTPRHSSPSHPFFLLVFEAPPRARSENFFEVSEDDFAPVDSRRFQSPSSSFFNPPFDPGTPFVFDEMISSFPAHNLFPPKAWVGHRCPPSLYNFGALLCSHSPFFGSLIVALSSQPVCWSCFVKPSRPFLPLRCLPFLVPFPFFLAHGPIPSCISFRGRMF